MGKGDTSMADVNYTCDVCYQNFDDRDNLADHMVTYHSKKTVEVQEGEEKY